jgi:hypothetical protein
MRIAVLAAMLVFAAPASAQTPMIEGTDFGDFLKGSATEDQFHA